MSDDIHEVYAIRYGNLERPKWENFIGGDPHDTAISPITYFVWAIKGPHGNFVIDTGFDDAMAKKRGRKLERPIPEGLKAIGIDADKVENVIISHMHYDHAGNHEMFPSARYHVQDCEMAYASGRCMCHKALRVPFEAEDVSAMIRKIFADRVDFHDGTDEIAPGITVHLIGGHSKGLQSVRVKTRRGHVVLASDAVHLYEHMEQGKIFPLTYNVGDVLEGYQTLKRLAQTPRDVIPGHDPLVLAQFPAAAPGTEDWVVRLDADPKRP